MSKGEEDEEEKLIMTMFYCSLDLDHPHDDSFFG